MLSIRDCSLCFVHGFHTLSDELPDDRGCICGLPDGREPTSDLARFSGPSKGHIFCTEIKILNSESHDLGLLSLYTF